jgi:putative transposase
MRALAFCLMPNHFHLVVWPEKDGDLSRWMHWLQNAHVRRYHEHSRSSGHIRQGRFKAFAIEQDDHLLTVLRYVERNPVRANLVRRAEKWKWSSARHWGIEDGPEFLTAGPVRRPKDWPGGVNRASSTTELEALRRCINRGSPFGSEGWVTKTAAEMGLESTLRPRGRPRKRPRRGKMENRPEIKRACPVLVPFSFLWQNSMRRTKARARSGSNAS